MGMCRRGYRDFRKDIHLCHDIIDFEGKKRMQRYSHTKNSISQIRCAYVDLC